MDWRQSLKLWNYCCRLARYMLDEGLLDRHDFLTWIIELLDKRAPEDGLLRSVLFTKIFVNIYIFYCTY